MNEKKQKESAVPQPEDFTLETDAPPMSAAPTLGMDDIRTILGIINVASKAGAFSAGQMATVGNMYNKLDSFLTWINENAVTTNETNPEADQGE